MRGTPPSFRGPRRSAGPPCARCRHERAIREQPGRLPLNQLLRRLEPDFHSLHAKPFLPPAGGVTTQVTFSIFAAAALKKRPSHTSTCRDARTIGASAGNDALYSNRWRFVKKYRRNHRTLCVIFPSLSDGDRACLATGPRPLDGARGRFRRLGWRGHFVGGAGHSLNGRYGMFGRCRTVTPP